MNNCLTKTLFVSFKTLILFCLFNTYALDAAQENQTNSGIFTYKIESALEEGTETFYFKNNKSRRHKKIKLITDANYTETLEIHDGKSYYHINLNDKTGIKASLPNLAKENNLSPEITKQINQHIQSISDSLTPLKTTLSTKSNNETTFFGKKCKVISGTIFKSYLWQGYILRQEITFPIKKVKEITDMKLNIKLSDSLFNPPEDIIISKFNRQELSNLISSLKAHFSNAETTITKGIKK